MYNKIILWVLILGAIGASIKLVSVAYCNLYKDPVTVRLIPSQLGCNFEDALFVVDSVYGNHKQDLHKIVLPVFEPGQSDKYALIYPEDKNSAQVVDIIAIGRVSLFANVESWYGCTGSYRFKIDSLLKIDT